MRVFPTAFVAGAALAAGALFALTPAEPASAMTLRLNPVLGATSSAETALPVEQVRHRGNRHHRYDRGRHGPRYKYRRGRNRHYYGGYWYAFPWWLGFYSAPSYGPYYAPRRPRYSGGSCTYWSQRCNENWSRRSDYLGCMRYYGC